MAILEIVTPETNEEVLRGETSVVVDLNDPAVQQLIDDMIETMHSQEGVGLAAPQVGRPIKLAVIETLPEYDDEGEPIEGSRQQFVIINPEIVWTSRKTLPGIEGCLSLPGYVGEVERAHAIRVKALDRLGRKKRYRLKGWDARIFQHEIDHLNGILYTDKLTAPENFWSEEEYEQMRQQESTQEQVA